MAVAEFEEKQYECAFNVELGASGPVFASGQVLEKLTGYDASAAPTADHALWKILTIPRPPGIRLVPDHWSPAARSMRPDAAKLPLHPVSFIAQFKRPEYLQGSTAAQYRLWNQPYYRFTRTQHQHLQLRRLEAQLAGDATIMYASPAFHRMAELEQAQLRGAVVASTGFVSPSRLGRHKIWTYVRPGTVGRGNPDGEEISFASFEALFAPAPQAERGGLANRSGLREHLASIADACREVAGARSRLVDAWIRDVVEATGAPRETLEAVRDYALVQSLVLGLGASWWLVDGDSMTPTIT